jgi:hypothetical protein
VVLDCNLCIASLIPVSFWPGRVGGFCSWRGALSSSHCVNGCLCISNSHRFLLLQSISQHRSINQQAAINNATLNKVQRLFSSCRGPYGLRCFPAAALSFPWCKSPPHACYRYCTSDSCCLLLACLLAVGSC